MDRIYHTWDKWECYPAGFHNNTPPDGMTAKEAVIRYAAFLRDTAAFEAALSRVLAEWPFSCEHNLTNESMNRIAWLGQASACIALWLPACFRSGFGLLTETDKRMANQTALKALNRWRAAHGESELTLETARSKTEANHF